MFAMIVAAILTFTGNSQALAEQRVVLIAAKGSGIETLSHHDIRRIFLGLKSADSAHVNSPVLNLHDKGVYEEFLKNVMHMTEGTYKRKLVKRIFRYGTEEIKEVSMLHELNAHLISNVGDISFVDYTDVAKMQDIEVVKVLW
jgi:hypothetical protein